MSRNTGAANYHLSVNNGTGVASPPLAALPCGKPRWRHTAGKVVVSKNAIAYRKSDFQVYRRLEGSPSGPLMWLPMRRGIADLHPRAEVSQGVNERYLNALASTDDTTRRKELVAPLERPVIRDGKRSRTLRPFDEQDRLLLEAISRGEFIINSFRNKALQGLLYATIAQPVAESRRRSAAVNRKLRLLRDHGLIQKIQKSYRYKVTTKGRSVLTALIAAFNVTVNTLIPKDA